MRGRKPKPTAVKEREGAFVKDPQRRNKREPKPRPGAPPVPPHVKVDPVATEEWANLCEWLDDMKILAQADRTLMAHYCTTYSEYLKHYKHVAKHGVSVPTAAGGVTTSPEAHQYNKLADRLIKLCAELGLTPSARSRISVAEPSKEDDPMEAILLKFQGG